MDIIHNFEMKRGVVNCQGQDISDTVLGLRCLGLASFYPCSYCSPWDLAWTLDP